MCLIYHFFNILFVDLVFADKARIDHLIESVYNTV